MPIALSIIPIAFVLFGFGRELAGMLMPRKGKSDARGIAAMKGN